MQFPNHVLNNSVGAVYSGLDRPSGQAFGTEFIEWARASPGRLNYASPGIGSVHHLATEMFKQSSAIDMVHVPYKGGMYAVCWPVKFRPCSNPCPARCLTCRQAKSGFSA